MPEFKPQAQMRLQLTENASAYLEALLAEQHAYGPVCPQHDIKISDEGRCAWCDFDEASQKAPSWVARIQSGLAFGKALS